MLKYNKASSIRIMFCLNKKLCKTQLFLLINSTTLCNFHLCMIKCLYEQKIYKIIVLFECLNVRMCACALVLASLLQKNVFCFYLTKVIYSSSKCKSTSDDLLEKREFSWHKKHFNYNLAVFHVRYTLLSRIGAKGYVI